MFSFQKTSGNIRKYVLENKQPINIFQTYGWQTSEYLVNSLLNHGNEKDFVKTFINKKVKDSYHVTATDALKYSLINKENIYDEAIIKSIEKIGNKTRLIISISQECVIDIQEIYVIFILYGSFMFMFWFVLCLYSIDEKFK